MGTGGEWNGCKRVGISCQRVLAECHMGTDPLLEACWLALQHVWSRLLLPDGTANIMQAAATMRRQQALRICLLASQRVARATHATELEVNPRNWFEANMAATLHTK